MPSEKETTSKAKKTTTKKTTKTTSVKKTTKKAPAKKVATKKTTKATSSQKSPAKKTTKATSAKTTTKKDPAKKAATKKTTKATAAKKSPAKKITTKKTTATTSKKITAKDAKAKVAKAVKNSKAKAKEIEASIKAKASSKNTSIKHKTSWKDNSWLYYAYNFILVSVLTVAVRMLSALGLANYMGLDWSLNYKLKYIPVLAFSERNVQLFEKMNTLSLVVTTFVIALIFVVTLYKNLVTKQDYNRYIVRSNAWFIGIFISMVTFIASLFMSESIHFATNILGLIPITAVLLISCVLYFVKMDKADKQFK